MLWNKNKVEEHGSPMTYYTKSEYIRLCNENKGGRRRCLLWASWSVDQQPPAPKLFELLLVTRPPPWEFIWLSFGAICIHYIVSAIFLLFRLPQHAVISSGNRTYSFYDNKNNKYLVIDIANRTTTTKGEVVFKWKIFFRTQNREKHSANILFSGSLLP